MKSPYFLLHQSHVPIADRKPPLPAQKVARNNLVIDLGTLTDEYEKEISIHTTATSKDGEKTILAGKEVTIVDTVKLDGLTKGTKYQFFNVLYH